VLERGFTELTEYFRGHLQARRAEPGEDLISYMLTAKYPDGEPFKENHILGSLRLLLVAGIDTTWSGIGSSLWHLAKTPADRRCLARDPALVPTAIEEFLRAYAPVTMARLVAKETTLNGCTFKEGEMVMLSFPAANRDPAMFPDADKVIIDRKENRHAAFGLGIHRCVGSNLARMEMTVAVEEFLKRIPDFELAGEVRWSEGAIRGPRRLPVTFDR
jgi:cytochrome P450